VNGTLQLCAWAWPSFRATSRYNEPSTYEHHQEERCLALALLCDGSVDMPNSQFRMSPKDSSFYPYSKVSVDEGYCYDSWLPLFAVQFAALALVIVLALAVFIASCRGRHAQTERHDEINQKSFTDDTAHKQTNPLDVKICYINTPTTF